MDSAIQIIGQTISEGCRSFWRLHFRNSMLFTLTLSVLFGGIAFLSAHSSIFVPVKLILGSLLSALLGYVFMRRSTHALGSVMGKLLVSHSEGFRAGIRVGFMNAVFALSMGFAVFVGFHYLLPLLFAWENGSRFIVLSVAKFSSFYLSFAFGASIQTLWTRLSGGFFKSTTDIASDWTSRIEFDLPEDDLRNPALIADQVGDQVGNGLLVGVNWFEKWVFGVVSVGMFSAMISTLSPASMVHLHIFPLLIFLALGSVSGLVSVGLGLSLGNRLSVSRWVPTVVVINLVLNLAFLWGLPLPFPRVTLLAVSMGVGLNAFYMLLIPALTKLKGAVIATLSSLRFEGAIIYIVGHFGAGFASLFFLGIPIAVTSSLVYRLSGGSPHFLLGIMGIGYLLIGFLSPSFLEICVSSPAGIWDNCCALCKIIQAPDDRQCDAHALDGLGKVYAGTIKILNACAFFLGSTIFATAYIFNLWQLLQNHSNFQSPMGATISRAIFNVGELAHFFFLFLQNPRVILGVLVGCMVPFVFSGIFIFCFIQVFKTIQYEVRHQFFHKKGIATGDILPDYSAVISQTLRCAQKWTLLPVLLSLIVPINLSIVLGIQGGCGFIIGVACSGFLISASYVIIGTLFNSSKKYVQSFHHDPDRSDFITLITGDALGDVFKDCLGPCVSILVRTICVTTLIAALVTLTLELR